MVMVVKAISYKLRNVFRQTYDASARRFKCTKQMQRSCI